MSIAPRSTHTAQVIINPVGQTHEDVNEIVATLLARAGCLGCGRLAYLAVEFAGDPGPDLAKAGVISENTAGVG